MGCCKSKPKKLFVVIMQLADNENQIKAAYDKYVDMATRLVRSLPKNTSYAVKEQKVKEMLSHQPDVFELIQASLYKVDKNQRYNTLDTDIGPIILFDDTYGTRTKNWVVEKLLVHVMYESFQG